MNDYLQLSVYLDETDVSGDVPLYEAVVRRLLSMNVAGATVYRGIMGYGKHGKVHRTRLFGVSDDRPIIVVAIDRAETIRRTLSELRSMIREGLITVQPIEVIELDSQQNT
jgi:PII-like signaling protein